MSEHEHPLTEGKIIKEYVPTLPYAGEGCEEHYDERVIKDDASYVGALNTKVNVKNPYLKAMVLGEVLSTPRCKVPYGKGRR